MIRKVTREVTTYEIRCDQCGRLFRDYIGAWFDPQLGIALAKTERYGWTNTDSRLLCDGAWFDPQLGIALAKTERYGWTNTDSRLLCDVCSATTTSGETK